MKHLLKIKNTTFDFTQRTHIMGVLNVTPDSFSDGGCFDTVEAAVKQAVAMQEQGADFLDIGGESTRPGSESLPPDEEKNRVIPVLKALKDKVTIPISIDSYKPEVIEAAIEYGAVIINDITGLTNREVRKLALKHQLPVIIMHMQGTPANMQLNPTYDDVIEEIGVFFKKQTSVIIDEGLHPSKIIIDPGVGFGKTLKHNLEIISRISELKQVGFPILIGASRKSFISSIIGTETDKRLPGTIAANVIAIANGANIIRVHDVAENKQAMQIAEAILISI